MKYQKRENELLDFKKLAKRILDENLKFNETAKGWKKSVVEKNIYNLKCIIRDLKRDLKKENIIRYVESSKFIDQNKDLYSKNIRESIKIIYPHFQEIISQSSSFFITFNIASNTIFSTIEYDINWVVHPTRTEMVKISFGIEKPNILVKYIPNCIDLIKRELNDIKPLPFNINFIEEIILNACALSNNESFASSNVLLITSLEAICLKLIEFVYSLQSPNLTKENIYCEIYEKYGSLNKLIHRINLKPDLPIKYTEAVTLYKHSNDDTIVRMDKEYQEHKHAYRDCKLELNRLIKISNPENNNISVEEKSILIKEILDKLKYKMENKFLRDINETQLIKLSVKLNFLCRKIYEDRNKILHGQFEGIGHDWRNYMYYIGIYRLFELIKTYKKLYAKKTM